MALKVTRYLAPLMIKNRSLNIFCGYPYSFLKIPGKAKPESFSARPSPLASRRLVLTTFFTQAQNILALLLSSLSSSLNLPPNASLTNLHRDNVPSSDILRLLHYLPQPLSETGAPQAPHTDLGSLTLLFTKSPGLQVLHPYSTHWAPVDPMPNCAIVNIGDGMSLPTSRFPRLYSSRYCCLRKEN